MSFRDDIEQRVQGLIDVGIATASAVTTTAKQVTVTILGMVFESDDGGNESRSGQVLYGNAAVLLRPAAPEGEGDEQVGMEVVFVRSGDDMIPIAHRETRWQVDLDEGEVVVRGLGENAARVRLHPDGTATLEAETIKLGSAEASEGVPLGDALKSWLAGHRHGYIDSVGTAGTPTPSITTEPTALATNVTLAGILTPGTVDDPPDPSDKVLVE